jgi:hypothetical protein
MNKRQMEAKRELEDRIKQELPVVVESNDHVFTRVQRVTVTIGLMGAYGLPAVRTYVEGLETAVNAWPLWNQQKERDDADPLRASARRTGHLSPIVDASWRCGYEGCPCKYESLVIRKERSLQTDRKI